MTLLRAFTRARAGREQGGAVMIFVAVAFPVTLGIAGLSIDIGNWFEHRRHLQTQATAGALAGGGAFRFPCSSTVNAVITQAVKDYSGDASDASSTANHNDQVGGTPAERMHRRINSRFYAKDRTLDRTQYEDTTVDTQSPCEARMVDLKLTEADLPWFLKPLKIKEFIDAHARVEIRKQTSARGLLPIGVPDVRPKKAHAYFVDEATGDILASTPLTKQAASGGLTRWDNSAAPLTMDISKRDIGVRIALSGATSVTCGEPLVTCYDSPADSDHRGILHIRGYSPKGTGSGSDPLVRGVELRPGAGAGCQAADGPYFQSSGGCTVGVVADVDFGRTPDEATDDLTARVVGKNTDYPLDYDSASGRWASATDIPVAAGAGPVELTLSWKTSSATGTFGVVQRTFAASDELSGPIKLANVTEAATLDYAHSLPRCVDPGDTCARSLVVTIGIKSAFADVAQSASDPPVELRVSGGNQTQSVDCDELLTNLKDELAGGCATGYRENAGETCPKTYNEVKTVYAEPYPCVAVETGQPPNQVAEGLNERILGDRQATVCTSPNRWDDYFTVGLPEGDPRVIQVFLTPFGSFSGTGSNTVPVLTFASFYVTGWKGSGGGFQNPCQSSGDDVPENKGAIVGHFISHISDVNNGGATGELCDPEELGLCVPVLTR